MAAAGRLFVVAGGDAAAIEAAAPLLDAIGQRTFVISDTPKAANLVKLSGNFLGASVIESLGEALALVGKAGIDERQYLEFLTSTLFDAPIYKTYGALIADGRFTPPGFAAPLGQKDIRLVLAAAEDLRVPMPVASLLRDRFLICSPTAATNSTGPPSAGCRPRMRALPVTRAFSTNCKGDAMERIAIGKLRSDDVANWTWHLGDRRLDVGRHRRSSIHRHHTLGRRTRHDADRHGPGLWLRPFRGDRRQGACRRFVLPEASSSARRACTSAGGDHLDPRLGEEPPFAGVQVPDAPEPEPVRADDPVHRIGKESGREGEDHPVGIPGRRRLNGVEVAVGVDPHDVEIVPQGRERHDGAQRQEWLPPHGEQQVAGTSDTLPVLLLPAGGLHHLGDAHGHGIRPQSGGSAMSPWSITRLSSCPRKSSSPVARRASGACRTAWRGSPSVVGKPSTWMVIAVVCPQCWEESMQCSICTCAYSGSPGAFLPVRL